MERFVVNIQIKDIWERDNLRAPTHAPAAAAPSGGSARLRLLLDFDSGPTSSRPVAAPAPVPDPNVSSSAPPSSSPSLAHNASGTSALQQDGDDDDDSEDDMAVSEGEVRPRAKRPREYLSTNLSEEQKKLVLEKLLAKNPNGSFKLSVPEVLQFFVYNFPSIGSALNMKTLGNWRRGPKDGPRKKCGRAYTLAEHLRNEAAIMLKAMGAAGSPMDSKIARPILQGWLRQKGLFHLFSPTPAPNKISFSKSWINELFLEFKLSDRKGTTDAQHLPHDWPQQLLHMCYRIAHMVFLDNVPPELVVNLDQWGQRILATRNRTRVVQGTKTVGIIGGEDKRQITGVGAVSASGDFVGIQAIWTGKTTACHPKNVPSHSQLLHSHSSNHWSNLETMKDYVLRLLIPFFKDKIARLGLPQHQPCILILDHWKVHLLVEFRDFLSRCTPPIKVAFIPPGLTPKGQGTSFLALLRSIPLHYLTSGIVMDVSVNHPLKTITTQLASDHVAAQVCAQLGTNPNLAPKVDIKLSSLKAIVVEGHIKALEHFATDVGKKIILSGFTKTGISRCFDLQFQREAAQWLTGAGSAAHFIPDTSSEVPPGELEYVGFDERLDFPEFPVEIDEDIDFELLTLV